MAKIKFSSAVTFQQKGMPCKHNIKSFLGVCPDEVVGGSPKKSINGDRFNRLSAGTELCQLSEGCMPSPLLGFSCYFLQSSIPPFTVMECQP